MSEGTETQDTADRPIIVVLGPYRSGTTCMAGVLYHLGLHMGLKFHGAKMAPPLGYLEAMGLCKICWEIYKEPHPVRRKPDDWIAQRLGGWFQWHDGVAAESGKLAGAKHPLLCAMLPELRQAVPNLKVVNVIRPIEESIRSIQAQEWWKIWKCEPDECEAFQRYLWQQREAHIGGVDHIPVPYRDLLEDPAGHIARIAEYVGCRPTDQQFKAAVEQVKPRLKHF